MQEAGHQREPGIYNPIERHNVHRYWRPYDERLWTDELRSTGHRMIDAYVDLSEDRTPDFLEDTKYAPAELVANLLQEDVIDSDDCYGTLETMGFGSVYDTDDLDAYWDAAFDAIEKHTPVPTVAIDQLHRLWDSRVGMAYDNEPAQRFRAQAADWTSGFIEGTKRLIDSGRLPITQEEFAKRLAHPPEIAYVPQYVVRLRDLQLGGRGADVPFGAFSDHSYGRILVNAVPDDPDIERSRFIHENVHFFLDGLFTYDTTQTTGLRVPTDRHIGMWTVDLSINPKEMELEDSFEGTAGSERLELNEGATEIITADIHNAVPDLGTFATTGQYKSWYTLWRHMESLGLDMTPFLGFKVTDQTLNPKTSADRYSWYDATVWEFHRVFHPRAEAYDAPDLWTAFDRRVAETTRSQDIRDDSPEPFVSLLGRVSLRDRLARRKHHVNPSEAVGRHQLRHGNLITRARLRDKRHLPYAK